MPVFVVLFNISNQGMKNIKEAPQGLEQAHKAIEKMGGKVLACYCVMGEYDSVGIYEMPSDEAMLSWALGMAASGTVRTTTMKAFTIEAFVEAIKRLPEG